MIELSEESLYQSPKTKKMVLLLYFILSISLTATKSNPIIAFLHKMKKNPIQLISHGVILTEEYILTTKLPLDDIETSKTCAIPMRNNLNDYEDYTNDFIDANCKDIKRKFRANTTNLSVVKLQKAIIFLFQVNPASIPAITSTRFNAAGENIDFLKYCEMFYDKRKISGGYEFPDFVESVPVQKAQLELSQATGLEKIKVKLDTSKLFCASDSGLPLYCNQAVVGLFLYDPDWEASHKYSCEVRDEIFAVNLINKAAQKFIKPFLGFDVKNVSRV